MIEKLKNWNPVHAGQFHNDRLNATFLKPIYQPMQESVVNVPKLRGSGVRCVMCIVAPMSMAAAFG